MNNVYSVGQINNYIRRMFQQDILLSRVYVRGEVSNLKYHTSGHIYFSLKDETGTLSCVMFAGNRKGLTFAMKNGDKVICAGNFDVYTRGDMLLTFVSLVVVAPICEEIIFRGWLYGKMRSRLTAPLAMLLTSLLFGLMHGQINVGLTVFVMSLVMCIIRELTGTVYGGIVVHMLKNGLAMQGLKLQVQLVEL